jgi:hypothetical protein
MNGEPVKHGAYVAYMLRLWRTGNRAGRPVWRASLENPHTGERLAFGDTEALFAFLGDLTTFRAEVSDSLEKTEPGDLDACASGPSPGESKGGMSSDDNG